MLGRTLADAGPWLLTELLLPALLLAAVAYLLGCFNGAVIVSKYILRDDIRRHGSGNAGLTNFYRTFGGALTVVVILCDVLKMAAAVWAGQLLLRYWGGGFWAREATMFLYAKYWAGLFCLLGHMFPCMFRFRGGKGILSGGTLAILVDWRIALVVWGGFLLLFLLTRYVSLGSVFAGVSFPFLSWYCYPDPVVVVLAFCTGGLVVWKHWENIPRLVQGKERRFHFHRDKNTQ